MPLVGMHGREHVGHQAHVSQQRREQALCLGRTADLGEQGLSGCVRGGVAATRVKRHVGVVERDWPRAGMAQIRVQDRTFRVGDTLCIQGPRTGDATFEVASIRHDDEVWDEARKGDWCTVPSPARVRPGDRVYAVVPRN